MKRLILAVLVAVSVVLLGSATSFSQSPSLLSDSVPFSTAVQYPTLEKPYHIFISDLDGDDYPDLIVAQFYNGSISVFKNNGDGTFPAGVSYSVPEPTSVFAADLDGDDDRDLAVTSLFSGTVSVLKNNGDGTFAPRVSYAARFGSTYVVASDLDSDDDSDLVVMNYGECNPYASILMNYGDGTFATALDYDVGGCARSVVASDLDNDGDPDLAVTHNIVSPICVLKNNGDGTFAGKVDYALNDRSTILVTSDLDDDGDLDIAVDSYDSSRVAVFKNNGDGTFASKVTYPTGSHPISIFAADFDLDGDQDLVTANYSAGNVSILENDSNAVFGSKVDYATVSNPFSVFGADLDQDGDVDLATVANDFADSVTVLMNLSLCSSAPRIIGISPKSVTENETLLVNVSTYCCCTTPPALSIPNPPNNVSLTDNGDGTGVLRFTPDFTQSGAYSIAVLACDTAVCDTEFVQVNVSCGVTMRGDLNNNGFITLPDIVYLVNYLLKNGPAPQPEPCDGDANANGSISLADVIYLVNFVFKDGPPPTPSTCCI